MPFHTVSQRVYIVNARPLRRNRHVITS